MLTLTDTAKDQVRGLINEETGNRLRVFVKGGGCSGFQYGLAFDEAKEDDAVVDMDGFEVVVDPASQPHLNGVTVDFVTTDVGAGFKFDNPNATGGCGCGQSFC